MSRGTKLAIAMISVGLAASLFAWHFVWRQSQRLLELWGGEVASMIRASPRVEFLRLQAREGATEVNASREVPLTNRESLLILNRQYAIVRRVDITQRPGLIHARAALISDSSYVWTRRPSDTQWRFALRFHGNGSNSTLALDLNSNQVTCVEQGKSVLLTAKIARGLEAFLESL